MPMSREDPKTAEEWERYDVVPIGNADVSEGIKYFEMHEFQFRANENYSTLTAGSIKDFSENRSELDRFIATWETDGLSPIIGWVDKGMYVSPWGGWAESSLGDTPPSSWQRRMDMSVYASVVNGTIGKEWTCLRGNRSFLRSQYCMSVTSRRAGQEGLAPSLASLCGDRTASEIRVPGVFIQGVPLCIELPLIRLSHNLRFDVAVSPTDRCRLVIWLALQQRSSELFWQWCGAVYSWRHCRMEPVDNVDSASQNVISHALMPISRGWSKHINDFMASQQNGSASPFPKGMFDSDISL